MSTGVVVGLVLGGFAVFEVQLLGARLSRSERRLERQIEDVRRRIGGMDTRPPTPWSRRR